MLRPDERQAVRGDLVESGATGSEALRDVLGLVVRHQATPWTHWRPWLTLASVVVPLGMLLSVVSRSTADGSAVYVWMYANNWKWGDLGTAGFWHVFVETALLVFRGYLALACWSWTSGFVLGSISPRMIQTNGVLFFLMLLFGALVGAPRYFAYYWSFRHGANGPVFSLVFYRETFPLIVLALLVVGRSLWGIRQGERTERLRPLLRQVLWVVAIATLPAMVIQNPELSVSLGLFRRREIWGGWQIWLLQLVAYWPVGYLVADAIGRHSHRRMSSI